MKSKFAAKALFSTILILTAASAEARECGLTAEAAQQNVIAQIQYDLQLFRKDRQKIWLVDSLPVASLSADQRVLFPMFRLDLAERYPARDGDPLSGYSADLGSLTLKLPCRGSLGELLLPRFVQTLSLASEEISQNEDGSPDEVISLLRRSIGEKSDWQEYRVFPLANTLQIAGNQEFQLELVLIPKSLKDPRELKESTRFASFRGELNNGQNSNQKVEFSETRPAISVNPYAP